MEFALDTAVLTDLFKQLGNNCLTPEDKIDEGKTIVKGDNLQQ